MENQTHNSEVKGARHRIEINTEGQLRGAMYPHFFM